jgi:hypothetical protein
MTKVNYKIYKIILRLKYILLNNKINHLHFKLKNENLR